VGGDLYLTLSISNVHQEAIKAEMLISHAENDIYIFVKKKIAVCRYLLFAKCHLTLNKQWMNLNLNLV
jgi:hypothetical protein